MIKQGGVLKGAKIETYGKYQHIYFYVNDLLGKSNQQRKKKEFEHLVNGRATLTLSMSTSLAYNSRNSTEGWFLMFEACFVFLIFFFFFFFFFLLY